jgi:hypothetical protein
LAESLISLGIKDRFIPNEVTKRNFSKVVLNGVAVTDEIWDGAMIYVRDVLELFFEIWRGTGAKPLWGIEAKIQATYIHETSFGTCDFFLWDSVNQCLYIWDFKFGFGFVDAFENWQLINYAAGIFSRPELAGCTGETQVELRVCQPRAFGHGWPTRHWRVSFSDLVEYINQLQAAAKQALSPQPVTRSGSHCRYCKARHACRTAAEASRVVFEIVGPPVSADQTPEDLGRELEIVYRAMKAAEYRYEGLVAQVESLLQKNQRVPGWDLKSRYSKRDWQINTEEIEMIGQSMGLELTKKTPLTAKQAIDAGVPKDVVDTLTKYRPGKRYVQPSDNTEGRRLFGGKPQQ